MSQNEFPGQSQIRAEEKNSSEATKSLKREAGKKLSSRKNERKGFEAKNSFWRVSSKMAAEVSISPTSVEVIKSTAPGCLRLRINIKPLSILNDTNLIETS